ncbi:DUF5988 family protein [Actinomadura sp. DC4]|uniref:DUF5988 family protein n=1 Tax=Actinomadura sp. DC4 TaxID=3055069 RepID=UPI0025B1E1D3|nr:DUF5988 family protein [Actinomadura sp. DC4]MDN3357931.1 DUF5988 family protein [Actinomadura sp. DC4]
MEELINVSLEGGPESIPRTVSVERSKFQDGKLKIEHLGGYEHFERAVSGEGGVSGGPDGALPEIFRWTLRTKIAE